MTRRKVGMRRSVGYKETSCASSEILVVIDVTSGRNIVNFYSTPKNENQALSAPIRQVFTANNYIGRNKMLHLAAANVTVCGNAIGGEFHELAGDLANAALDVEQNLNETKITGMMAVGKTQCGAHKDVLQS